MAKKPKLTRTKSGVVYRGERFPGVNKPKRAPSSSKKKMRVLAKEGDKMRVIEFGSKGYGHNYSAGARANFKARHNCKTATSKLTARYWACKTLWSGPKGSKKSPPKGSRRK